MAVSLRLTDAITDELSWMVGSAEDFTCTHAVALTRKLSCELSAERLAA